MRKFIFFTLYFAEGAPIGFIWWTLPALLEKHGLDLTTIATISALATLPWTFKFLLAPIIDLISLNYMSLKRQLFIYQLLMGIPLFFIPYSIDQAQTYLIITVLLIHGIFAAAQDICIDSLAIKTIPEDQLGLINGIMQMGMLTGRSFFGGAGIFLAYKFGISSLIYFLISCIWISMISLKKSKLNDNAQKEIHFKKYLQDFKLLISKKLFWILILLTYFSGFSYNGISTIASAVLSKKGVSVNLHTLTYSLIIPICMSFGAITMGRASDRKNPKFILKLSLLFSVFTSLIVGWVMDHHNHQGILISSYGLFYIAIGATTASLYSFLMKHTTKEFAALEFSIFMGVTNFCDSSASYLTGQLVQSNSYTFTATIIGIICLFSFILLQLNTDDL